MAEKSEKAAFEMFQLFSSASDDNSQFRFGLFDSSETPLSPPPPPPPPPCVEVPLTEVSSSARYTVEPVNLNGFTLLKLRMKGIKGLNLYQLINCILSPLVQNDGRVNTQEVFALSNSDLVPGKYEGGLKLWEGSLDLVKALRSEVQNGLLSFKGKQVLEIGCGHGLPGILACLEGAAVVHFQDFNAEVLQCLTIPNVNANLSDKSSSSATNASEVRFFAGDWSEIHQLLPHACDNEKDEACRTGQSTAGYDIILMAETVYSISSLQTLYELIKKAIGRPHGVVYMAAKKYYFGVGGGSRRFLSVVAKDGIMVASLVAEVTDGSSNVREVWKFSLK